MTSEEIKHVLENSDPPFVKREWQEWLVMGLLEIGYQLAVMNERADGCGFCGASESEYQKRHAAQLSEKCRRCSHSRDAHTHSGQYGTHCAACDCDAFVVPA